MTGETGGEGVFMEKIMNLVLKMLSFIYCSCDMSENFSIHISLKLREV